VNDIVIDIEINETLRFSQGDIDASVSFWAKRRISVNLVLRGVVLIMKRHHHGY